MLTPDQEHDAQLFIEEIADAGPISQVRAVRRRMSAEPRLIQAVAVQRWYVATWPRYERACAALGHNPFDPVLPDAD